MPSTTPLASRLVYNIMTTSARMHWAEPEVLGLAALVRPGDHVFDVGAAYGMYTFPLAHLVGSTGSVNTFEPQKREQRMLRTLKGATGAQHISVSQSALGALPGEQTMLLPYRYGLPIYGHTHVAAGTDKALTPQPNRMKAWSTPMNTVDSWCEQKNIDTVSFIKVDVEGFEPDVLDGATHTIEKSRPSLLLEIEDRHIGRYGRNANEFADEIRDCWSDYDMYTWGKVSGGAAQWNATDRVELGTRNYLFATKAAFARTA